MKWRKNEPAEPNPQDKVAEMERLAEELHQRALELRTKISQYRKEEGYVTGGNS